MPAIIDLPVDGVITQPFGGQHGGVDLVDIWGEGAPVYASCDGVLALHPQGSWGDGSYGNAAKISTTDGWHVLVAHLSSFAPDVYDGMPVQAGKRLGYQGHTGYTVPAGPGGSHVHWGMCRVAWFPKYSSSSAAYFEDPLQHLIPEGERMAIFQKLEAIETFIGGAGGVGATRIQGWNSVGNLPLLDCLGAQPGDLATFPAVRDQAYGLNNVLLQWRPALMAANPGLVLP